MHNYSLKPLVLQVYQGVQAHNNALRRLVGKLHSSRNRRTWQTASAAQQVALVAEAVHHARMLKPWSLVNKGSRLEQAVADLQPMDDEAEQGQWEAAAALSTTGHDVILVTYETLSKDLYHTNEARSKLRRSLRRSAQRYRVAQTPLDRVDWWRIALDEAQMIDTPTARAAITARQLPAVSSLL